MEQTMRVRFDQSGGYAGLIKGCEIDTTTLPPEKAKEIEQLVKQSGTLTSGNFLSDSSRDLQQYEITIEDGPVKTSAVFDDKTVPHSAKPLIGFLKKCAKPRPPGS
jgi:hypothetical protein